MKESIPQNELAINKVAKTKLQQASQDPDQTGLYLLELADWGLAEIWDSSNKDHESLQLLLQNLRQLPTDQITEQFYPTPSQSDSAAEELAKLEPLEAAQTVLNDLAAEQFE